MNQMARGGCVVASETSYSYMPIAGQVFTTALNLAHTNYFLPRYGAATRSTWKDRSSVSAPRAACTDLGLCGGRGAAHSRHPKYWREIQAFDLRWEETCGDFIAGTVAIHEELIGKEVPTFAISNFSGRSG